MSGTWYITLNSISMNMMIRIWLLPQLLLVPANCQSQCLTFIPHST